MYLNNSPNIKNSLFTIEKPNEGFQFLELAVYDRWGSLVHSCDHEACILAGWDGTFNGKKVEKGVYVYSLKYNSLNASDQLIYGTITIL